MDAGGLAQMSTGAFPSPALGGLASRRGVAPLSFDAVKASTVDRDDGGAPTPRTSRSHLLAGLRTAPKTSTGAVFPPSPTTHAAPSHSFGRNAGANNSQERYYNNPPKTALPSFAAHGHHASQMGPHYTVDQVLAPPEIHIDDQAQETDPNQYAQMMATNMFLAQQQQQLQQQLLRIQAAAQQFNMNNVQQQYGMHVPQHQQLQHQQLQHQQLQQQLQLQQQQQLRMQQFQQMQLQQQLAATSISAQPNVYAYVDPATGQPTYFVDQNALQLNQAYDVSANPAFAQHQQQNGGMPRVQVSPPPEMHHPQSFRTATPPKRYESPVEHVPLPPPSANAFRRGHKKAGSLANINSSLGAGITDAPRSAGPKTASFPLTPLAGGYGPGQARAGEHPVRQPRNPPSMDELLAKPTAKHDGSKNFAARTRRSAVDNLVRAGRVRRQGTGSSLGSGSMSPVSETAEEAGTPLTDNESESGRSGSGSLAGDVECSLGPRSSASSTWGAIGSDRPSSRQKTRGSLDSTASETEVPSFANVFKNRSTSVTPDAVADAHRKAPMLVLTKTLA